jgi:ankyrin repeat protein
MNPPLIELMRVIASGDGATAERLLADSPDLATARLERGATRANPDEFFLDELKAYVYTGDTALHVAAFAYDSAFARKLVAAGADVRAKNRRGAEPLHSAANGGPGSPTWNPRRQAAVIAYLIEAGADPNATASGGVTPLHRAVRNRCTPAVRALLAAGADPHQMNDSGSTAFTLAEWTTGRSGSGSAEAKREQANIIRLLASTG